MFWIILVAVILFLVEVKVQLNDKTYLKKELRSILSGCAGEGLTFS